MATLSFLEFLYGILLVLSGCCFHHIVENSILYKKILFSENKIKWSVVGGKVDGQILSGTRDEKRTNLFGTKWQFRKILFGSQRVNRLYRSYGILSHIDSSGLILQIELYAAITMAICYKQTQCVLQHPTSLCPWTLTFFAVHCKHKQYCLQSWPWIALLCGRYTALHIFIFTASAGERKIGHCIDDIKQSISKSIEDRVYVVRNITAPALHRQCNN